MSSSIDPSEFDSFWVSAVSKSATLKGDQFLAFVNESCQNISNISTENVISWSKSAFTQMSPISDHGHIEAFYRIFIKYLLDWLFTEVQPRLNLVVEIINNGLHMLNVECFVQYLLEEIGILFCQAEEETPFDMNLFLALQAPIYSYCVNHEQNSQAIYECWFYALCASRGATIFGPNKKKALDYFKLMNHAFFQNAVLPLSPDIPPGEPVDPTFLEVQKHLKGAIAALATELDTL